MRYAIIEQIIFFICTNIIKTKNIYSLSAIIILLLLGVDDFIYGWTRTYGGSGNDAGISVIRTTDGGYIVVGWTNSFGASGYDVYLIKTDSLGDTLWTRTYGGSGNDQGISVIKTIDGGYIIVGLTSSFGAGGDDVYLVKTDSLGDTLWTRTYGGSGNDKGISVIKTTDSCYIIAGWTNSFGAGGYDVYLIKTDSLGDTLWTRTYGGSGDDKGYSVAQTTDGGYIISGGTSSFGAGGEDIYLIKTDSLGDTLWTRTYGGSGGDRGFSVKQTTDSCYIVAGWKVTGLSADMYIMKIDSLGDTVWTCTCGGSGSDAATSIAQTNDGGYIVTGVYDESVTCDVYLVKIDSLGDTIWTRTFGGSNREEAYSVVQTADSGYIIAGWTNSFGAGGYDVYLIKTDSLGSALTIKRDAAKNHIVFSLLVYPNPFNSSCMIIVPTGAQVEIYDLKGDIVASYLSEKTTAPSGMKDGWNIILKRVMVNSSSSHRVYVWAPDKYIPSGLYLLKVRTINGDCIIKRIFYLK